MFFRYLLVALLAIGLAAGVSQAATLPYQNNVTFTSVGTTNMTLPQFDPALGTLTSVTVNIYGTGHATFAADNDYTLAGIDATAHMQHDFLVTAPGVSANGGDSYVNTVTLSPDNGDGLSVFDPTGPDGHSWGSVVQGEYLTPGSPVSVGAGFWGAYTGTGNVLIGVNSQSFTSEITGSAPWFDQSTAYYLQNTVTDPSLNVRVQVTYGYTPNDVPEPTTLALLGIGACGLGLRARRRTKKNKVVA